MRNSPIIYLQWSLVYVDDLIIASSSEDSIEEIKKGIVKEFKLQSLGEPSFILGCEFGRYQNGIGNSKTISLYRRTIKHF